jgi:hypothetical protein
MTLKIHTVLCGDEVVKVTVGENGLPRYARLIDILSSIQSAMSYIKEQFPLPQGYGWSVQNFDAYVVKYG